MLRALAVVVAIGCGCSRVQARQVHRVAEVATAGGLVGVVGFGVAASLVPEHDDTIMNVGLAFVPISILGALLYITTDESHHHEHAPKQKLTRRERNRAAAWDLTQQAASAARHEDCTQVQALAPRVRELDVDFHLAVFMRDVAIQRCLRGR